MYSISTDRHEQDMHVHLVQRFQVIEGGKQTEQTRPLAKWVFRGGKLVCKWNVKN